MIDLIWTCFPLRSRPEVVLEIHGYVTVKARCWRYISSGPLALNEEASTHVPPEEWDPSVLQHPELGQSESVERFHELRVHRL